MRAILAIIGLAAIALVVAMSLGMVSLNSTSGSLPTVRVEGGQAPKFDAEVGRIDVGTTNRTVEVPTVTTTTKTIEVPTVNVEKAPKAEGTPQ